jgi:Ser-tRNA(Ala) deacylase AlaX
MVANVKRMSVTRYMRTNSKRSTSYTHFGGHQGDLGKIANVKSMRNVRKKRKRRRLHFVRALRDAKA